MTEPKSDGKAVCWKVDKGVDAVDGAGEKDT